MRIEQNYSLKEHNTFHINVNTRWFIEYENEKELLNILHDEYFRKCLSLHIGEGSNLLFINDFNGIIFHSQIKGTKVLKESAEHVLLRIGAAEHWDDVVSFAISKGWGGIENLSYIPGEAGAAAVQNIGAYDIEIKDVIETVEAYNQLTCERKIFTKEECAYNYRHSRFKENDREPYIITHINIKLLKTPDYNLNYGNLKEKLAGKDISLRSVRETVIEMRKSKLPEIKEYGNAGSFFMNPYICSEHYECLKKYYPEIPFYPVNKEVVKISAAWLIEQCGFKGKREGNVGTYPKQALVIINYGGATGEEIISYAEKIQKAVKEKFYIELTKEVKCVQ
ncbi:MAG: UDP-N-acetylmuramate dehydrogenase [Tannerella sp.]|jgi:UDP-N-acetylmuramate dehydrogenase|nr:UDP-N-acetylmuramate dehydrogenase [Tannerella sp.]